MRTYYVGAETTHEKCFVISVLFWACFFFWYPDILPYRVHFPWFLSPFSFFGDINSVVNVMPKLKVYKQKLISSSYMPSSPNPVWH